MKVRNTYIPDQNVFEERIKSTLQKTILLRRIVIPAKAGTSPHDIEEYINPTFDGNEGNEQVRQLLTEVALCAAMTVPIIEHR